MMPNFGADDFDTIRTNLERIKKEKEEANGVDIGPVTDATNNGSTGGPEPIYMGCTSDPPDSEAYRRFIQNPVTGVPPIQQQIQESWRDYLLSPISGRFVHSEGWGKLYNVG